MAATEGDTTPAVDPAPPHRRFGPWRREVRSFVELLALTGVAVAQPALDLLTKNPGMFVTLQTTGIEAVALALFIVLVPPAALWIIEVLIGLAVPRSRRYAHAVIAAGIVGVLAIEVLKHQTDLRKALLVAFAVILGLLGGWLVLRFEVVRLWLRYLAIAPAIFVVLFLFSSSVTAVVFDTGTAPAKDVTVGKPSRVVMVVMDELPIGSLLDGTGHFDAALFPNFAALAGNSTWFRNNTTVAPYTDEAVPAILSGSYPEGEYVPPVASEYPHNLFTMLGGRYRMNVHESVTRLCPTGTCTNAGEVGAVDDPFRELLDTTYSLWSEYASPNRATATLMLGEAQDDFEAVSTGNNFVRSIRPATGPQLDFLHVLLPHQPWHFRPTGQDDERVALVPPGLYVDAWIDQWSALAARERHLLQLQAGDRLLGRVIAKLKRIGSYDDSLIVVVADHGVAFEPRQAARGVSLQNYPQILWTPMLIHRPGQVEGVIDDHPVQTVDILPTIADVLDVKVGWKFDGRSMFTTGVAERDPRIFRWDRSTLKPPPGSDYVTFPDGNDVGFAEALAGTASASTGPLDLRLYQTGEWGALVGRPAAPLVQSAWKSFSATIADADLLDHVDPGAKFIPWAAVKGDLQPNTPGVPLAIAVNGVIAATSVSTIANGTPGGFSASLPPQLFRKGRNALRVYAITGTPERPRLVRVPRA